MLSLSHLALASYTSLTGTHYLFVFYLSRNMFQMQEMHITLSLQRENQFIRKTGNNPGWYAVQLNALPGTETGPHSTAFCNQKKTIYHFKT